MNKILAQDGIRQSPWDSDCPVLMDNIEAARGTDEITHISSGPPPVRMPAWAAVIIPPWSALPAATRRYGCHGPLGLCGVPQVLGGGRLPRGRFGLLVNTYLKYLSKEYVYMPPTCSCAATSAPASAAGVAFLHG